MEVTLLAEVPLVAITAIKEFPFAGAAPNVTLIVVDAPDPVFPVAD